MNIKILTPEFVVFEGDVKSVLLPGKNGDFHIMKDHAAIVASLIGGKVKVFTNEIDDKYAKNFTKENEKESVFSFPVKSGVIEFSNNKGIILAE
ncbi:F0F1 ATP synthase subunit epsilon [Kaistella haifensis]|uniref:ATPase n=1 Tax=Kaistella haifensis DSM 19056 TaxID=1450526 RepID=A0A246BB09_9FLAO|nr:F0F1 ATP synthase subunit epsilon [Kaistella haifensis]AZB22350.1 F0F1 ATP synthase subunit epsilon [Kaistella haifensis]MBP6378708.1 F0F1 ATP synthase subunit epsilon [Kaistella sp.]MDN5577856.1 F0F1 ATP synthase subunit epsilon [Chryseobacterium sp.]OWK98831.1 ATPase [Kaistella haifensis DSM 19056]